MAFTGSDELLQLLKPTETGSAALFSAHTISWEVHGNKCYKSIHWPSIYTAAFAIDTLRFEYALVMKCNKNFQKDLNIKYLPPAQNS